MAATYEPIYGLSEDEVNIYPRCTFFKLRKNDTPHTLSHVWLFQTLARTLANWTVKHITTFRSNIPCCQFNCPLLACTARLLDYRWRSQELVIALLKRRCECELFILTWTPRRLRISNTAYIDNTVLKTWTQASAVFLLLHGLHPSSCDIRQTGHQTSPRQAQIVRLGSVLNDPSGWLQ